MYSLKEIHFKSIHHCIEEAGNEVDLMTNNQSARTRYILDGQKNEF